MSLEVRNVTKNYGATCALNQVSVTFEKNKIYGLLGRNGAGKTTLLNVITNRIFPDSGEVLLDGVPSRENDKALRQIYMMSEKDFYPVNMKIKDIFRWTKEFYHDFDMEYANNLANIFELNINKNIKSLSTGYKSIFKVIIALSVNTPYVFLDEPVLGLDANHRDLFYRLLIEKYSELSSTFVISTHLIEEVSSIIEQIIIIKKGNLIRNESRDDLMACGYTVTGKASLVDEYAQGMNIIGCDSIGGLKSAYIIGSIPRERVPEGLEISKMDLQKLFIKLTDN